MCAWHSKCLTFFIYILSFNRRACWQRLHSPADTLIPIIMSVIAGAVIGNAYSGSTLYMGVPSGLSNGTVAQSLYFESINNPVMNVISTAWLNISICCVLICAVAGCSVFGFEKSQFYREQSAGMSAIAYYWAKDVESYIWIIVFSLVYSSIIQGLIGFRQGYGAVLVAVIGQFYSMTFILFEME